MTEKATRLAAKYPKGMLDCAVPGMEKRGRCHSAQKRPTTALARSGPKRSSSAGSRYPRQPVSSPREVKRSTSAKTSGKRGSLDQSAGPGRAMASAAATIAGANRAATAVQRPLNRQRVRRRAISRTPDRPSPMAAVIRAAAPGANAPTGVRVALPAMTANQSGHDSSSVRPANAATRFTRATVTDPGAPALVGPAQKLESADAQRLLGAEREGRIDRGCPPRGDERRGGRRRAEERGQGSEGARIRRAHSVEQSAQHAPQRERRGHAQRDPRSDQPHRLA